jgi:molybdopterin-containing oxidoreductase family molybdopterin binding subunit
MTKQQNVKEDVWIPTTCNMCFNGCSILVHRVDGVPIKIEGNPKSPVGAGRVCGKGASGLMQLYDPKRITKPMKRTNPRKGLDQDPGWVEITWEEAYTLAVEKIKEVEKVNPKLIVYDTMVTNVANMQPVMWYFGAALGAQFFCADICGAAIHNIYDRYTATGNSAPDYDLCKCVLQFGTQAGTATRHGFNMSVNRFAEAREKGCKLIDVDPHMSMAGEKADIWVPIKPGTDGALAMTIAHVLVHELGLYDKEYLKKHTNSPDLVDTSTGMMIRHPETKKSYIWDPVDNKAKTIDDPTIKDRALTGSFKVNGKEVKTAFQVYMEYIEPMTPEWAEKITDVPATQIREVAKVFGETANIGGTIMIGGKEYPYRPSASDCFSGATRHKHAARTVWAILHLNVLIGGCNVPGGLIGYNPRCEGFPETGLPNWDPGTYGPDEFMNAAIMMYPHSGESDCYKHWENPVTFAPGVDLPMLSLQPINGGDAHFIFPVQQNPEKYKQERAKLLICYANNVVKNWGNHEEMADFLRSFEYMISIDIYKSDGTFFADLLLPEACYLERFDCLPNDSAGNHHCVGNLQTPWHLSIRQPVVPARDGAPGGMDIVLELAYRTGKLPIYLTILNQMFRMSGENELDVTKKYTFPEILDHMYKAWAGPERGLEWFKKNGVLTWDRKPEEVYLYPYVRHDRIPLYNDQFIRMGKEVAAEVKKYNIPWEQIEDYQPLPGYAPCCDHDDTKPDYDLWPIYYTNALNVDTWGLVNPWINEINNDEPYGYTIEINAATAKKKGFKNGDDVVLIGTSGYRVQGRLMCVEGIHPQTLAVGGGCWDIKSKYIPKRDRGVAINNLFEVRDPKRLDHLSAGYDQCIRVKMIRA